MPTLAIRFAESKDAALVLSFIKKLAEYEKLSHEVKATEEIIRNSLFGKNPRAKAIIAELDGKPIGFAIYFYNFSTFLGQYGIYIEDLYVDKEHRGQGYGKDLLRFIAARAVEEGCGRVEWWVLDWNEPSIAFYKSLGAVPMDEWIVFRLTGDALKDLSTLGE